MTSRHVKLPIDRAKPRWGNLLSGLLVAGIWLSGCTSPDTSGDVVLTASDSVLAQVLHDLHRVDAIVFEASVEQGVQTLSTAGRDSVLVAHDMSEESFMSAMDARILDPARLLAIYNLSLDQASRN